MSTLSESNSINNSNSISMSNKKRKLNNHDNIESKGQGSLAYKENIKIENDDDVDTQNTTQDDDDDDEWTEETDRKFKESIVKKASSTRKSRDQKRHDLENLLQKAQCYSKFIDGKKKKN